MKTWDMVLLVTKPLICLHGDGHLILTRGEDKEGSCPNEDSSYGKLLRLQGQSIVLSTGEKLFGKFGNFS